MHDGDREQGVISVGISIFYELELDVEDMVNDVLVQIGSEGLKSEDDVVLVRVDD